MFDADAEVQIADPGEQVRGGAGHGFEAARAVARHGARGHRHRDSGAQSDHAPDVGLRKRGADAAGHDFGEQCGVHASPREGLTRNQRTEMCGVLFHEDATRLDEGSAQAGDEHQSRVAGAEGVAKAQGNFWTGKG